MFQQVMLSLKLGQEIAGETDVVPSNELLSFAGAGSSTSFFHRLTTQPSGRVASVGLCGQPQTCVPAADKLRAGQAFPGWAGSVCAQGTARPGKGKAEVESREEDRFGTPQAVDSAGNSVTARALSSYTASDPDLLAGKCSAAQLAER